MKVDGVVFDYGNTLVLDPFERVLDLKGNDFLKVMERKGYEVSRKRFLGAWREVNQKVNYPFCSHFAQDTRFISKTLEKLGFSGRGKSSLSSQLLGVYREGLRYVLENDKRLLKVKKVLGGLKRKGKRLYIISNEMTDTLNLQISFAGLGGFFEEVISSESVGFEKPDPRIFRYLLKVTGLPRERTVCVGDDPERDIKPAKTLGMKAILLKLPEEMSVKAWRDYNYQLKPEEKPDFVIKDIEELLEIVE